MLMFTLLLTIAPNPESAEQSLLAVQRAAMLAWNAGDLEALLEHYSDDAVILMAGAPAFQGIDAIRAVSKGGIEAGIKLLSLEATDVWASGELGVIRARYTTETPAAAGTRRGSGHLLAVLRYDGDRWRVVAESWTPSDSAR